MTSIKDATLITDMDFHIDELKEQLAERDAEIGKLQSQVAKRDVRIDELRATIAERDAEIAHMVSHMWDDVPLDAIAFLVGFVERGLGRTWQSNSVAEWANKIVAGRERR